ncbi:MAG: hypothetical protein V1752_08780 [Candidatus Firestonebacteria bacterium]
MQIEKEKIERILSNYKYVDESPDLRNTVISKAKIAWNKKEVKSFNTFFDRFNIRKWFAPAYLTVLASVFALIIAMSIYIGKYYNNGRTSDTNEKTVSAGSIEADKNSMKEDTNVAENVTKEQEVNIAVKNESIVTAAVAKEQLLVANLSTQRPINPFPRLRIYYDSSEKEVSREENKKLYVLDSPDSWKIPDGIGMFKQYYLIYLDHSHQNRLTGTMDYYYQKKLKSEGGYRNNKLDGFFKEYYILEEMEFNYKFDKGKLSECKVKDGTLREETNYSRGLENGIRKFYDINGTLIGETNYSKGKKTGIERFYVNGKLCEETNYLNGEKYGISKLWNPNINNWLYYDECIYKNGVFMEGQRHNFAKKTGKDTTVYVGGKKFIPDGKTEKLVMKEYFLEGRLKMSRLITETEANRTAFRIYYDNNKKEIGSEVITSYSGDEEIDTKKLTDGTGIIRDYENHKQEDSVGWYEKNGKKLRESTYKNNREVKRTTF